MSDASQNQPRSRESSIWVLSGSMLALQFVAGICYPIAKYGLETIEPFTFAFYRFIISSAVLLLITRFLPNRVRVERSDWKRIIILGILIIPFNQTLFLVGQSLTAAGHGAFLFATTPVWVFVLALIHLKEKATWQRVVGIVIATAGVMVVMLSGAREFGTGYLIGDGIILVSVIAWGYYTVLGKKLVLKYGALVVTAYSLAAGSLLYLPFGLFFALDYDYSQSTPAAWGAVLYMAIGLSVFVYVLWYWLLKRFEASRLAVYHNAQPVIATIVAFLFLGETLTTPFVIGGVAVIIGVIVTEV